MRGPRSPLVWVMSAYRNGRHHGPVKVTAITPREAVERFISETFPDAAVGADLKLGVGGDGFTARVTLTTAGSGGTPESSVAGIAGVRESTGFRESA